MVISVIENVYDGCDYTIFKRAYSQPMYIEKSLRRLDAVHVIGEFACLSSY